MFSKTSTLAPMVIRCQWPQTCIQFLNEPGQRPKDTVDFIIHLILQKLARHSIGIELLKQLNCIDAFIRSQEQMQKDHNEENYSYEIATHRNIRKWAAERRHCLICRRD